MNRKTLGLAAVLLVGLLLLPQSTWAQRHWPRRGRRSRSVSRLAFPAPRLAAAVAYDTRVDGFGASGSLDLPLGHYVSLAPEGAYFRRAWRLGVDLAFRFRPRGILRFGGGVAFVKGVRWKAGESWRTCPSAFLSLGPRRVRPVSPYVEARWTLGGVPTMTLSAGLSFVLR